MRHQETGEDLLAEPGKRFSLFPSPDPGTALLFLRGDVGRADIPCLCREVQEFFRTNSVKTLGCDVSELAQPDAATVDALARMHLAASRLGKELKLLYASDELRELLILMGLDDIFALDEPTLRAEEAGGRGERDSRYRGRR